MMGNRHGESANAFRAVQARHEDIQRTLRTLAEVNAVFAEMRTLVIQQEPVVNQINEQSEVVHQNVDQANHQLDGAIKSAKAANRKKWYCLGIAGKSLTRMP
jgi:syntaxin 1B/2/3